MQEISLDLKQRDVSYNKIETLTYSEMETMTYEELQEKYYQKPEPKIITLRLIEPIKELKL